MFNSRERLLLGTLILDIDIEVPQIGTNSLTLSTTSERDSLTVRALACHAADPGSYLGQCGTIEEWIRKEI